MVAVDPRVIPLGTELHIEGYGSAVAADTGGAIQGQKIDLYMDSEHECLQWGRRKVEVQIRR
jgi:3D (Asp-Asp-Asp) domain-containing protein